MQALVISKTINFYERTTFDRLDPHDPYLCSDPWNTGFEDSDGHQTVIGFTGEFGGRTKPQIVHDIS